MPWKTLPCLLVTLMLAGCADFLASQTAASSQRHLGKTLTVHQSLTVPPHWARVFIQDGKTLGYGRFNEYFPMCYLEVKQVLPVTQTISPGRFQVTRIQETLEEVVQQEWPHYAGLMVAEDGGVPDQTALVRMDLRSDEQPEVLRLVCGGGLDIPARAEPPTDEQIRQALGSIATLAGP